ncbi:MAG: hypothetical protein ACREEM_32820, partial [Blastocatellia bacterium]
LRRIRTDQSVKIRFDPSNPWFLLLFLNRKMLGCLTAIPKEPKLILPRMRAHDIRYVQVARAGHLESDGIVVLDDTREPRTVYLDGAYKLSDELRAAGTLPQYAGAHRCSIKFKAWTIQKWIAQELAGEPYRHAIGYNAEEQRRIEKSDLAFAEREPVRVAFGFNANEGERIGKARAYDTPLRRGWYPLAEELGWDRDACQRYLKEITGETFLRSACTFCPFNNLKEDGIARLRRHPEKVAEALLLEYQSLCLNPRGTLYRNRTLLSIIVANHHAETLRHFRMRLEEAEYALYRVRRIYNAPGRADRAVERLETGSRGEMNNRFERISSSLGVRVEHDIRYGYVREREPDCYPAVEEFFVVAPAAIESKTRYGFDWFEAKWREALGETGQDRLFD